MVRSMGFRVWRDVRAEQSFMAEFAASKQCGMESLRATDKTKKRGCATFQLDLTVRSNQTFLGQWICSQRLLWLHLAPVCRTASRARDIGRLVGDPKPLTSDEFPESFPSPSDKDAERVGLANRLFAYLRKLFSIATALRILVTMENLRRSYFWRTVGYYNQCLNGPCYIVVYRHVCLGAAVTSGRPLLPMLASLTP